MTLALDPATPHAVINAGQSLPAAALTDGTLVDRVRGHGFAVTVRDDRDLDLVQRHRIRGFQVVCRCGPRTAVIRRAVGLGVRRFIVHTAHQLARLDECADSTLYLYLDDRAPLMLGDRRLKVIGLHADVDDVGTTAEWAIAAQGLVRRAALLQACGSSVNRIALSGGSTRLWLDDRPRAAAIVTAVERAVCAESDERRVPRPRVTVLTGGNDGRP